jgi:hypothetical protein
MPTPNRYRWRHRHIVGAVARALLPILCKSSTELSRRVAASRILEATCVRAPLSYSARARSSRH